MDKNDLFYIVIFLSTIGNMACILLLLIEKVTRVRFPFMFYLFIAFFYAVPLTVG